MSSLVTALQGETLDALAYRLYGTAAAGVLELLIELNPQYLPAATLSEHAPVTLPDRIQPQPVAAIRLWD